MIIRKCIFTENDSFKAAKKIYPKPSGIVVHSTGANNPYLKRYVQPVKGQCGYNEIIGHLGKNRYSNHWNQPRMYVYPDGTKTVGVWDKSKKPVRTNYEVSMHAFIGKAADGSVAVYQTLHFDICCWGCGGGKNGSYNYNPTAHIQFEICEDGLNDEHYFRQAFGVAEEFCAYLCLKLGLSPDDICSHKEAHRQGFASDHGDPENWLKKFGKTMDDFRQNVRKILEYKEV